MTSAEKLERLRARMMELDLDVYLVPSDDPHLSGEYAAAAAGAIHPLLVVLRTAQ